MTLAGKATIPIKFIRPWSGLPRKGWLSFRRRPFKKTSIALDINQENRTKPGNILGATWERTTFQASLFGRFFPHIIISVVIFGVCTWFAHPADQAYPMGDSYIHFQYAQNLAEYGELSYNPGLSEGIGSTSVLWILILAAGHKLGIPPHIAASGLGMGLLALSGVLLYDLVVRLIPAHPPWKRTLLATSISLLCCLSGNMVWIALSGMETILFTALALLSLSLYYRQKWLPTGLALGFLFLARVDGIALVLVIVLVEFYRSRRFEPGLGQLLGSFLAIALPWVVYLYVREGVPLPWSFQGKQVGYEQSLALIYDRNPGMARFMKLNPLVFLAGWVGYTILYMSGSAGIPGPQIHVPGVWEGAPVSVPIISLVFFTLVELPAAAYFGRYLWRRANSLNTQDAGDRMLLVFLFWTFTHNLAYALFMPQPGAAARYSPMNHFLFWASLVVLVFLVRDKIWKFLAAAVGIILAISSLGYWHQVYHANIDYHHQVRIPAAEYIAANCSADVPVGTTDLGPLAYFTNQPVLDLIGYVNKDIVPVWLNGGSIQEYILDQGIECMYLFMPVDGVGEDTRQVLGLVPDSRFDLILERSFTVTVDEWLLGSAAVSNYMPSISIFRIVYLD